MQAALFEDESPPAPRKLRRVMVIGSWPDGRMDGWQLPDGRWLRVRPGESTYEVAPGPPISTEPSGLVPA